MWDTNAANSYSNAMTHTLCPDQQSQKCHLTVVLLKVTVRSEIIVIGPWLDYVVKAKGWGKKNCSSSQFQFILAQMNNVRVNSICRC